ncbi:hypothetical protein D3C84_1079850 [compost metagenome]
MIGVVMGDQDVAELPARVGGEPGQHRRGVARIDHRAVAAGMILQEPEIVVAEGG